MNAAFPPWLLINMQMLLGRTYRVIYDGNYGQATSFSCIVNTVMGWHGMISRLEYKQSGWPQRYYRLQIWDGERGVWLDHSQNTSKYALFSED